MAARKALPDGVFPVRHPYCVNYRLCAHCCEKARVRLVWVHRASCRARVAVLRIRGPTATRQPIAVYHHPNLYTDTPHTWQTRESQTMITPFKPDRGGIDFDALQRLVDWYVASGVDGLFALCLSSEMYQLSSDERLALVRAVVAAAAGRVPVVACGAFGGPIEEQAAEVRRIGKEVDAVVIVVSQLAAPGEPDDVWIANAQKLLDLTADDEIPLGLYECPLPYHRLLSADMLAWAAKTGRFAFHKDTCCAKGPISAKLAAVRAAGEESPFKFYNANVATLKFSLEEGGNGFSGISGVLLVLASC